MQDGDNKNERNAANQETTSENNIFNKNTKIIIGLNKNGEDEDGHLIENNLLTKKKSTPVEDYLVSSLLWKDLYPQMLASCVSLLIVIQPGINLAYSNNLLHHVPSLNKGQFSWITSILALSTPVGAFIIGPIMDRIGRKKACLLTCIPLLASWLIASVVSFDCIYMFYASRVCAGIGGGMTTVGLVYVTEISHSSYKQMLLSMNSVFFSSGILIATSLAHLDWNVINASFVALTVINMALITICMPESPVWLMKFKSSESTHKAKAALKRIYPENDQVFKTEWNRLNVVSDPRVAAATDTPSFIQSMKSSPSAYKPMAILVGLMLLQQLSGAYPTISYALPILKSVAGNEDESVGQIGSLEVLGTIRFVSAVFTCPLSFYVGRRPLLMCSCAGMALSSAMVVLTVNAGSSDRVPWALCGVMLYVFSSSLGVLVFPWTLVCELLSTSVRAVGGSLLVSYGYLLMFVVLKAFPYALAALSVANVFLAFGVVSLSTAVYVYFAVPETLGKTFQEVEEYFVAASPHGK